MSEENNQTTKEQKTSQNNISEDSKTQEKEKIVAILSYLLVGIVWFFADEKLKKNDFARFHVKQAIVLFIASLAVQILLSVTFLFFLIPLYYLVALTLTIIGIMNAANKEKKELPFIGSYAKYLKF